MGPHVHFQIVFPLELGRTLVTNIVFIVRVYQHVTPKLGLDKEGLGTVGTEIIAENALVSGRVPLEVVEVVAGVIALVTVILSHVLVYADDMVVQRLLIGTHKVVAMDTDVRFAAFSVFMDGFLVDLHFT